MSYSPKKTQDLMLLIEKRKDFDLPQESRFKGGLNDNEMIDFGIHCAEYSLKSKDWRFLNLALKILDSELIFANKNNLNYSVSLCLKELESL